ncbi:hypothetical protein NXS19_011992 [Fusarium pseudograminearum]|nr:hypothetical protein NXS19_011992 [Fusarium pseudograminearum]
MQRVATNSICSLCRFTYRPAATIRTSLQPCLSQRLASQHFKPRPSRMVLSDRVGQAPHPAMTDKDAARLQAPLVG